jgi:hypothetical protein
MDLFRLFFMAYRQQGRCPVDPGIYLLNIDAQDAQDFSGNGWRGILSIGKLAPDHRRSQLPVHERPVLFILCILCIDVQ